MTGKKFDEPKLHINKIYTRTGDSGNTRLAGGQSLPKDHPRIKAYGNVDELNALLGICREETKQQAPMHPELEKLSQVLIRLQHELFNLGAYLSTLPEDIHPGLPRVTDAEVTLLEREIDEINSGLPALKSFVLPGGTALNALLHQARTVCRRTERRCVALAQTVELDGTVIIYLNRLSDALFVWSRWVNHTVSAPEVLWSPQESASGREDK